MNKEKDLIPFNEREYDLGFIAYNWKRVCKNYELVKKIIKHKKIDSRRILIVGLGQETYDSSEIDSFDNKSKNELIKLYQNCKSIVIPSFYDSNPNV